eukprot:jgi/Picre1/27174/NNA_000143.t1
MFSMLFAWMLRDFAKPVISHIPWIIKQFGKDGDQPPDEWFGEQAVFRLSLGNCILFSGLALVMSFPAPVKYKDDWRDAYIHHGGYLVKAMLWLVIKGVSPLFLAITDSSSSSMRRNAWNEAWVFEGEEDERYLYALLVATVGAYGASCVMIVLSYVWFSPSGPDCSLNMSLITIGLIACVVLSILTLHPSVRRVNPGASIFVASAITLYVSYLGFSALQSEPRDYECNMLGQRLNAASSTTLAMGMVLTLASTVWAAFRAGSNTRTFQTDAEDSLLEEAEMTSSGVDMAPSSDAGMTRDAASPAHKDQDREAVTYNYVQFYIIFALASMYTGMLMTGWGMVESKRI